MRKMAPKYRLQFFRKYEQKKIFFFAILETAIVEPHEGTRGSRAAGQQASSPAA